MTGMLVKREAKWLIPKFGLLEDQFKSYALKLSQKPGEVTHLSQGHTENS